MKTVFLAVVPPTAKSHLESDLRNKVTLALNSDDAAKPKLDDLLACVIEVHDVDAGMPDGLKNYLGYIAAKGGIWVYCVGCYGLDTTNFRQSCELIGLQPYSFTLDEFRSRILPIVTKAAKCGGLRI